MIASPPGPTLMGIDVLWVATILSGVAAAAVMFAIYAALSVRDPMSKRVKALNDRREQLKAGITASTSKRRAKLVQKSETADKLRDLLSSLKMLQDEQVRAAQQKLMQAGIRKKDWAIGVIFGRVALPGADQGAGEVGLARAHRAVQQHTVARPQQRRKDAGETGGQRLVGVGDTGERGHRPEPSLCDRPGKGPRQPPSARPSARASAARVAASWSIRAPVSRAEGPASASAATGLPKPPKTGAAMLDNPACHSPASRVTPVWRMVARSAVSIPWSVRVASV